ncbi:hypothetical protein [Mycobacterium sp. SMC-4]|uniref:hypothetical protein n=1 Tax=Mycobacterium sp. SMC-4 TaxID=2857059 RepID=UPI003D02B19B
MSVRPDNRLADAPMQPVDCRTCGARVLVRKSSWEQTSVQWNAAAVERCVHRRTAGRDGERFLSGCAGLRESIETAVRQGSLRVLSDT